MPRRDDLRRILILGSGPIVIGQAAEFDYSGVQACKVLREEGYEIVLVNSNPATIMTDPELADATYVEPLLPGPVAKVIERERPDALLPTLGGQTALNLAKALADDGTLERFGVELIGANYDAITTAEDRDLFRDAMEGAGLRMPASAIATNLDEVDAAAGRLGLPCIVRPAYTLGGRGGGIARTHEELRTIAARGIAASPIGQVLLDQSVIGWGEFELEVMRDAADNVVIVCSIENLDPMGVHTGDSVTVAPQQTLSDHLYQRLRDQAMHVIRTVGVETGGSNVQFAVHPETEEILVIEMNPRVSRSSALASKATGFPIAKIAARLAVGYTLEEIPNDITGGATPAAFEPTIDYVVVKWPRFAFEKFAGVSTELSTHMKSVGEAMAFGRTFGQAFAKAMRSRELDAVPRLDGLDLPTLLASLERPASDRFDVVLEAFRRGAPMEDVHARTAIDPWFLRELEILARDPEAPFAGARSYRAVDTCAAEFEAATPYFYSAWERTAVSEVERSDRPSVVILGAGPNRIGQGIEFDYCCVHAAMTVRASGRDAVMVNCNPETVSTDYDTSDRLYFEPLTLEDVLAVVEEERPEGVIVQFGGQTPLKLAAGLAEAGVPLLGTSVDAIDLAEDRGRFGALLARLGFEAPPYATAHSVDEALDACLQVGFPLLVRPSYVLGGRAMEIVYSRDGLADYLRRHARDGRPIFLDRFLENAIEVDVDALCDGEDVWIGGIMQHVEEAGIHSGDSASVLPPHSLGPEMLELIRMQTRGIALGLGVVGLLNVQYAVHAGRLYVIEANPRASRTVPFVSKATAVQLAKAAARIAVGQSIAELRATGVLPPTGDGADLPEDAPIAVKEAVLPFHRFRTVEGHGVDTVLGPEMKSTGEVMGLDSNFGRAFAKSQAAAYGSLPTEGTVFVSLANRDKRSAIFPVKRLADLGFRVLATGGTAQVLRRNGVACEVVGKYSEGPGNCVERILAGDVDIVVNTPFGSPGNSGPRLDGYEIRTAAVAAGIPCITTVQGMAAAVQGIEALRAKGVGVRSLQQVHAALAAARESM